MKNVTSIKEFDMKKTLFVFVGLVVCLSVLNAQSREVMALQEILKANNATWTAGDNNVNRLSPIEQENLFGMLPGIGDPARMPAPTMVREEVKGATFEAKHTPIRNQGQCGSCYSFGASATYESYQLVTQGETYDLSEQWFMMKAKAIGPYGGCSGWYLDTSMNLLKDHGVTAESCCPYKASESACPSTCQPTYKIKGWASTTDLNTIKAAIKQYGLVYVGFAVYNDFMSYSGGIYKYTTGSLRGYHAVAIVGYDDNNSCFKVKNSWGTGWGEQGYFRIGYDQMNNAVKFGTCFGGSFYITQ
jgi:hypothetical protein